MNTQTNKSVNVAVLQMSCGPDQSANVAKAEQQIRAAAANGANVVCTQELFHDFYPCQTEDHAWFGAAQPVPGPITMQMRQLAGELGIVLLISMFEKRAAGLYHNTAVVFDADGRQCGLYRKMHIPDDPLYYEKFYFTPGDLGFRSFETRFGKLGVCVCWDQWFPEAARLTALTGAEIIFYPTAIGWHPHEKAEFGTSQHSAWETMMRSHAIANGVYIAAANRIGTEGDIEFWGQSFIADPYGNVVTRASVDQPTELIASCDFNLSDTARTHWPFLRDRRIDAYAGLTQRYLDQSTHE